MSYLLSGISFIKSVTTVIDCLGLIFTGLIQFLIFGALYLLFAGIAIIAHFCEVCFKKLAGIDTIYLNGVEYLGGSGVDGTGQDLVYAFITDNAVQNVFWSILALSIVLLFIMTIIALIKSEFTLDMKGSAKGPIIGRALKSLANFIIVPVASLISIIGMNFITTSVYNMFGTENSSIVSKCFVLGAYNANRARLSEDFYNQLKSGNYYVNGAIFTNGSTNPFASCSSQEDMATMIDEYFTEQKVVNDLSYNKIEFIDRLGAYNDGSSSYLNVIGLFAGEPENGNFYYTQVDTVNMYYDIAKFDYVLAVGSLIVMAWTLLGVAIVLLKRVFEMTILFLLAPVMTAIAPLDGGQAEKKWRQEFMKRLLAVIGPIFAINMYFLLVPLFENITLFKNASEVWNSSKLVVSSTMLGDLSGFLLQFVNVFDLFFQIVCILTGLSVVKSASALLSNLLGIDDLIKAGDEAKKKAVDSGKKAFVGATAIGGVAFKGAAAAVKSTKFGRAAVDKIESAKSKIKKHLPFGKKGAKAEEVAAEEEFEKENGVSVKDFNEGLDSKKKTMDDAAKDVTAKKAKLAEMKRNGLKKGDATFDAASKELADVEARKTKAASDYYSAEMKGEEYNKKIEKIKKDDKDAKKEKRDNSFFGKIGNRIKQAYDEEYGEDSGKTNSLGKAAKWVEKNVGGKVKGIPILGNRVNKTLHSATEYFNISGDTATRRLNDALGGLFGEGGGGELWKINFNKNARASLYEGVPESKAREQGVQQSMLMEARNKYDKDEQVKKMKNDELKNLARYFAEQMHDPKYNKLTEDRENAEKSGDFEKVAKLDAQIEQMHADMGASQKAREFLPKSSKDADYQKWKSGIKDQATDDGLRKEAENKAYTEGRKLKVEADMANQTLKTSSTPEEKNAIAEQMAKKIQEAMQKGVPIKDISIEAISEAIVKGTEASAKAMEEAIRNALSALNKK